MKDRDQKRPHQEYTTFTDSIVFRLPNARSYTETEIHIVPDLKRGVAMFRFWQQGRFVEEHRVKLPQLKTLRF